MSVTDDRFMEEAIQEAIKALGRTSPNPPVGAVVVKNGNIVGRGFHPGAGRPHAEVFALEQAGAQTRGANIYVTLEPCNHHGRTPPCSQAIHEAGISKTIVGMKDPNPAAAGGLEYLASVGISSESGILEQRITRILEPFLMRIHEGRPLIALKMAQTLNGIAASKPGSPRMMITSEQANLAVHHLRDIHDAIMIGGRTARLDDPLLTCRMTGGRNPIRVVVDPHLASVHPDLRMLKQPGRTIILHYPDADKDKVRQLEHAGAEQLLLDPNQPLAQSIIKSISYIENISSVLLEGGPTLASFFLNSGLVDHAYFFVAPKISPSGISVLKPDRQVILEDISWMQMGPDLLLTGRLHDRDVRKEPFQGIILTEDIRNILVKPESHTVSKPHTSGN